MKSGDGKKRQIGAGERREELGTFEEDEVIGEKRQIET